MDANKMMRAYLIPFASYLLMPAVAYGLQLGGLFSYAVAMFVPGVLTFVFWKEYRLDFRKMGWRGLRGVVWGVIVFGAWILLEGRYPLLSGAGLADVVDFSGPLALSIRFVGFVMVTPLIEEIFTRGFLLRYLASEDWKDWSKVPVGKFTWFSFIVTVLFFGFSHAEWLQGLAAGILLNLCYYRSKSVEECIVAHAAANLLLMVF
ncbi:CAAX prenyl protease-related protein [Candidatus Woesearchaeota archaeon]|nr:CAAX prenyl protease-related protein [Candidatus Woesearchaeota archaeon]